MEERKLGYDVLEKYFSPMGKTSQIVGVILIVIGLIGIGIGWVFMYLGVCVLAAGVAILFIRRDSRASDADVDSAVSRQIGDIEYWAGREIDVREKMLKSFPTEHFGEFEFGGSVTDPDSFLMIRGRQDKRLRTNVYSATVVMFAQEMLHIYKHTVNLTKDDERVEKINEKYIDLSAAELIRTSLLCAQSDIKNRTAIEVGTCRVSVKNNAGEELISFPVTDGADIDKFVESINRIIKTRKEKLAQDGDAKA